MIRPGLTSVTFRQLAAEEIVGWAVRAQLEGIEWGGDVHTPPGRIDTARRVAAWTRDAGLAVASYGSYYRLGEEPDAFPSVVETAVAMNAPIVRVWAGRIASREARPADRERVAEDGRRISDLAARAGLRIACEWHGNTLTDEPDSARALFQAVDHPAFCTYWQPHKRTPFEDCMEDLNAALPRLIGLHVFHWAVESVTRLELAEGEAVWPHYLAKAAPAADMFAHLEFVKGGEPEQMLKDAATLRTWLAGLSPGLPN